MFRAGHLGFRGDMRWIGIMSGKGAHCASSLSVCAEDGTSQYSTIPASLPASSISCPAPTSRRHPHTPAPGWAWSSTSQTRRWEDAEMAGLQRDAHQKGGSGMKWIAGNRVSGDWTWRSHAGAEPNWTRRTRMGVSDRLPSVMLHSCPGRCQVGGWCSNRDRCPLHRSYMYRGCLV